MNFISFRKIKIFEKKQELRKDRIKSILFGWLVLGYSYFLLIRKLSNYFIHLFEKEVKTKTIRMMKGLQKNSDYNIKIYFTY